MAKFTSGAGFGVASGSIAAVCYSRNRFGAYIRNKAIPVNPVSTRQTVVRSRFGNLSQTWRTLTAAQRTSWNTQATTVTLVDPLGQQYQPTGHQFFVGINSNRIPAGIGQTTTPPAPTTAAVILTFTATAVGSTGVVTLTFTPAIVATNFYILEAASPRSAGINYVGRSQFKLAGYLDSTSVSPFVATTLLAALFGGLVAGDAGKAYFIRLTPLSANGFKGVPFEIKVIIS